MLTLRKLQRQAENKIFAKFIQIKKNFMKKILFIVSLLLIGCETNQNRENATWTFDASTGDYIEWQSENDFANEMTNAAFVHLYNVEYEKAMVFFEKALEYDPSLFGPHVVLAGFSEEGSEKQQMHISKAKELVENKNDTSKLFVSLLDLDKGGSWPLVTQGAHDVWKSMRDVEPKGKLIHYYFAFTIPGMENKIQEMELLLAELKDGVGDSESLAVSGDHSFMIAPIINTLGYFYYDIGNKVEAKNLFEEYLNLYPNGYNSYDSMGEFYYNEGDMENALIYYKKAKEMYPAATSANLMIEEISKS